MPTEIATPGAALLNWARATPDAPFLTFEHDSGEIAVRSYADVYLRARLMAGLLTSRGIGPGERVHVHMPNRTEFFDVWFGCCLLGAVMVPTNPLLTARELAYELDHSGARLSITTEEASGTVIRASTGRAPDTVLVTGSHLEDALLTSKPYCGPGPRPADPAAVLYTSGTTSRPKGVVVTNANYLHAGTVVARHLGVTPADTWLVVLPLFHANAQYYSTMSALVAGGSVAVMPRFSASRWAAQAAHHGATLASLFAAPIRMILAQPPAPDDSENHLRAVIFSQNVTADQVEVFENRFDTSLLQLYGMTETIAPPTINPSSGPRNNMSIGLPTAGTQLRVIDDNGTDVVPGDIGELIVKGDPAHTLMAGYLGDLEATSAALRDGWLYTGDLVRTDDDGFIHFVDRAKDMIKRAGENVSASEVEAVADTHPAVHESAAVGIPDEMRDAAIRLFCVLRKGQSVTEDELIAWCGERLASFKVPGSVRFVENLPRTSVGKVTKEVLRYAEAENPGWGDR